MEDEDSSRFYGALLTALEDNEVSHFTQILLENVDWDDADSILGHNSETRPFVQAILDIIYRFNNPRFLEVFLEILDRTNTPHFGDVPRLSIKT